MDIKAEIGVMFLQIREHQKLPDSHQKLGERPGTESPSQPPEGTNLAFTLILDFWPPELCDDQGLLFKPPSV